MSSTRLDLTSPLLQKSGKTSPAQKKSSLSYFGAKKAAPTGNEATVSQTEMFSYYINIENEVPQKEPLSFSNLPSDHLSQILEFLDFQDAMALGTSNSTHFNLVKAFFQKKNVKSDQIVLYKSMLPFLKDVLKIYDHSEVCQIYSVVSNSELLARFCTTASEVHGLGFEHPNFKRLIAELPAVQSSLIQKSTAFIRNKNALSVLSSILMAIFIIELIYAFSVIADGKLPSTGNIGEDIGIYLGIFLGTYIASLAVVACERKLTEAVNTHSRELTEKQKVFMTKKPVEAMKPFQNFFQLCNRMIKFAQQQYPQASDSLD